MRKPNYHQARKQREQAKKTRKEEKQQRRTARANVAEGSATEAPASTPVTEEPVSGDGS
jgi:hypothetical protein